MNLFKVENYPVCDIKDKIILMLLEQLRDSQRNGESVDYEWNLAFDLDTMKTVWTKADFVTYWVPQNEGENK